MNYAEYLRRKTKNQAKIIGFQNGQDATQVTYKAAARAQGKTNTVGVATSYSQIGGSIANIAPIENACASGYSGVANGLVNADTTAAVIGVAVHCAVCSDAPSSAPYATVVPCVTPLEDIKNAPGVTKCCKGDYSQLFRNNSEITRQQGLQSALRIRQNLPNKLQGLRGPIVLNRA